MPIQVSQVKKFEGEVVEKEGYITYLENMFSESTTSAMSLEVQLKAIDLKVRLAKSKAMVAKVNVAAAELATQAAS